MIATFTNRVLAISSPAGAYDQTIVQRLQAERHAYSFALFVEKYISWFFAMNDEAETHSEELLPRNGQPRTIASSSSSLVGNRSFLSLSLSLENRWTFTYLTYTFVSTSFWSVENNACSQPLLFPLVSGITSRRMRTRVACNTTVITRKRIVSRGSNGIVRVASQKLDLPRFHASCDPLKRESNLSKTYISFSLVY